MSINVAENCTKHRRMPLTQKARTFIALFLHIQHRAAAAGSERSHPEQGRKFHRRTAGPSEAYHGTVTEAATRFLCNCAIY